MSETQMDKEIEEYLQAYKVDFPNEEEVDASIEYIMSAVQPKKTGAHTFKDSALLLAKNSMMEFLNFGLFFWSLNSLFLLGGIISTSILSFNPYWTMITIAPLPFFIGLIEIMKNRDAGMIELEMTMKYTLQQLYTARLLVVGIYNLAINTAITGLCVFISPEVIFLKLLLSWTIPYVAVTGLAFFFALKEKGIIASGTAACLWYMFCSWAANSEIEELVSGSDMFLAILLLAVGLVLWGFNFKRLESMHVGRETYGA